MAVCHLGAGTEAGGQECYVKFGLARPGLGAEVRFGTLLDACESLAVDNGADHIELGVNAARQEAYAAVMARGLPGGTGRSEHAPGQRRGLQPPRHLARRRLALMFRSQRTHKDPMQGERS